MKCLATILSIPPLLLLTILPMLSIPHAYRHGQIVFRYMNDLVANVLQFVKVCVNQNTLHSSFPGNCPSLKSKNSLLILNQICRLLRNAARNQFQQWQDSIHFLKQEAASLSSTRLHELYTLMHTRACRKAHTHICVENGIDIQI